MNPRFRASDLGDRVVPQWRRGDVASIAARLLRPYERVPDAQMCLLCPFPSSREVFLDELRAQRRRDPAWA
jgi:hypothetical protein